MITQRWGEVLFLHWPVEPAALKPLVPFELDLHEGRAWLSVVAFEMTHSRLFGVPLPRVLEVNVRTYVPGGVFFLSLDASNALAAWLGRAWYGLPYRHARMSLAREGGRVRFTSGAEFAARYRPAGTVAPARPGTLEHFLVERYALFTTRTRVDVQHEPWPLQPADVSVEACTLQPVRVEGAPLAHFAREVHSRIAGPVRV
jgi:uncharacterized protein YqjF (DUF2071 family)